jgi:disulfide bond formation protein DsbB
MEPTPSRPRAGTWVLALLAGLGTAGSLALSLALGLKACPLCFYQRAFAMMALAGLVLAATARSEDGHLLGTRAAATAAFAGLVVAGFHVSLELRGTLECPAGLLSLGTAPQQSLAFLLLLAGVLGVRLLRWERGSVVLPLLLGAALGIGSLVANPPLPSVPTKAYTEPPAVCRPPYRAP